MKIIRLILSNYPDELPSDIKKSLESPQKVNFIENNSCDSSIWDNFLSKKYQPYDFYYPSYNEIYECKNVSQNLISNGYYTTKISIRQYSYHEYLFYFVEFEISEEQYWKIHNDEELNNEFYEFFLEIVILDNERKTYERVGVAVIDI